MIAPGNYGPLDRMLHRLALGSEAVRRMSFACESATLTDTGPADVARAADRPVYVCGLARSGTTILVRVLSGVSTLCSLRYEHMPFVLAPFLWRRASRRFRRPLEKAERAHGDGILVDLESPEAFEEVFWMTFGAEGSAGEVEQPTPDALRLFARYRRMVVRACDGGDEDRYLSKNNANLGRLPALCADSAASVLVCYRDPASTALSLHRQHQRFVSAQQQEPFIRDYMGWLGHFEFGLDHRPLDIAGNFASRSLGPGCPDYWLGYWIALHTYLLTQRGLRLVLVGHQRLCADPEGMLSALLARIGAVGEAQVLGRDVRVQPQADPGAFNGELLSTANAVFVGLSEDHRNISP